MQSSQSSSHQPFVALCPARQADIAPLAAQGNAWLDSLISTLQTACANEKTSLNVLALLQSAIRAAAGFNPTITFQHMAHECRNHYQAMIDSAPPPTSEAASAADTVNAPGGSFDTFITDVVPNIRILKKLDISKKQWLGFSEQSRVRIRTIVAQLGRMIKDYHAYMHLQTAQLIPGDTVGFANRIAIAVKQMTEEGGGDPGIQGILRSIESIGGLGMDNMSVFMSKMKNVPDLLLRAKAEITPLSKTPTPAEMACLYTQVETLLTSESNDPNSVVNAALDMFTKYCPQGLSSSDISSLIGRLSGLLMIGGAKKSDTVWLIVPRLKTYVHAMQKKTGKSRLSRETFIPKLIALGQVAIENQGDMQEVIEMATNSAIIKKYAGSYLGIPLTEITADPFAKAAAAGGDSSDSDESSDDD